MNNQKKNKLRRLLSKVSPEDQPELLADELREQIKEVEAKIPVPIDFTQSIEALKTALDTLQSEFNHKLTSLTKKEELSKLGQEFESKLTELKNQIPKVEAYDDSQIKKDFLTNIKVLEEKLKLYRMESMRGGSANQKISVNGSTVLRYNVRLNTTGASGYAYNTVGELTGLTLTGTNVLKITGTSSGVGSGSGDIVGKMGYVRFDSAA